MKARIQSENMLTKQQKKAIEDYVQNQQLWQMRRFFKLMCVALHEQFGFGRVRLAQAIAAIEKLSIEHEWDEIFWNHIDRVVVDELKLNFEREK